MITQFDQARFAADVKDWLGAKVLSYREAAALHAGLNPAMLSRACNQHVLSAASVLALCSHLGLQPFDYLLIDDPGKKNQPVTEIGKRETAAVSTREART